MAKKLDSIFEILKKIEGTVDLNDTRKVSHYIEKNYDVAKEVLVHLPVYVVAYKTGMDFKEIEDDTTVATMLAVHWMSNQQLVEEEFRTARVFLGYAVKVLREGGLNIDNPSDEDRVYEIISLALPKVFPGISLDDVLDQIASGVALVAGLKPYYTDFLTMRRKISELVRMTNKKVGFLYDHLGKVKESFRSTNKYWGIISDSEKKDITATMTRVFKKISDLMESMKGESFWKDLVEQPELSDKFSSWAVRNAVEVKRDLRKVYRKVDRVVVAYEEDYKKLNIVNIDLNHPNIVIEAYGIYREGIVNSIAECMRKTCDFEITDAGINVKGTYEDLYKISEVIANFAKKNRLHISGDEYKGYKLSRVVEDEPKKAEYLTEEFLRVISMISDDLDGVVLTPDMVRYEAGNIIFTAKGFNDPIGIKEILAGLPVDQVDRALVGFTEIVGFNDDGSPKKLVDLSDDDFERMTMDQVDVLFANLSYNIKSLVMETVVECDEKYYFVDFASGNVYNRKYSDKSELVPVEFGLFLVGASGGVVDLKVGDLVRAGEKTGIVKSVRMGKKELEIVVKAGEEEIVCLLVDVEKVK